MNRGEGGASRTSTPSRAPRAADGSCIPCAANVNRKELSPAALRARNTASGSADGTKTSDPGNTSGSSGQTASGSADGTKTGDSGKPSGVKNPTNAPSAAKPTKAPSGQTAAPQNDDGLQVLRPSEEDTRRNTEPEEGETEAISYKNPNSEGRKQDGGQTSDSGKSVTPTTAPRKTTEPTKTPEETAREIEELESGLTDLFIDLGNGAYELPEDFS